MTPRFISIVFMSILHLISASSLWGAVIVKADLTIMSCTLDSEQVIKVKTPSGESAIKLGDIVWISGRKSDLLFRVDPKFKDSLNNAHIEEELRKEFLDNGIELSDNVSVSIENRAWQITDEVHDSRHYILEGAKGGELDVRSGKTPRSMKTFTIDTKFRGDLDNDSIGEELRKEFRNNGIQLSDSISISVERAVWVLSDNYYSKKYNITEDPRFTKRLYIYGKSPQRIRKLREPELIKGEIDEQSIRILKGGKSSQISSEDISFLYNKDVDPERTGSLDIIECYKGTTMSSVVGGWDKGKRSDPFHVSLLTGNWAGGIRISEPGYSQGASSGEYIITFDIQGDDDLYEDIRKKAGDLIAVIRCDAIGQGGRPSQTTGRVLDQMRDSLPTRKDETGSISLKFTRPPKFHGSGQLYIYVAYVSDRMHLRTRTRKGVFIEHTVSNVLNLPLDFGEQ